MFFLAQNMQSPITSAHSMSEYMQQHDFLFRDTNKGYGIHAPVFSKRVSTAKATESLYFFLSLSRPRGNVHEADLLVKIGIQKQSVLAGTLNALYTNHMKLHSLVIRT